MLKKRYITTTKKVNHIMFNKTHKTNHELQRIIP